MKIAFARVFTLPRSLLCGAMLMVFGTGVVLADNWTFLKNTPLAAFTDEDHALMTQAIGAVLEDAKTPAKRHWQNPNSESSGLVETLIAFSGPKGESCKRLRVTNKAGSRDNKATYTLCRSESNGWQLASSDYAPVPKPASKTEGK